METAIDVTEQRRIERELFDRAYLDELTGLPNRGLIQQTTDELIASAAEGEEFALAFITGFAPQLERKAVARHVSTGEAVEWPAAPTWRERAVKVTARPVPAKA